MSKKKQINWLVLNIYFTTWLHQLSAQSRTFTKHPLCRILLQELFCRLFPRPRSLFFMLINTFIWNLCLQESIWKEPIDFNQVKFVTKIYGRVAWHHHQVWQNYNSILLGLCWFIFWAILMMKMIDVPNTIKLLKLLSCIRNKDCNHNPRIFL